jgi:hypothetical protein
MALVSNLLAIDAHLSSVLWSGLPLWPIGYDLYSVPNQEVGNTGQTTNTEVCATTKLDPTLRLFVSLRTGARKDLMRTMKKEMSAFRIHHDHVIYHKEQMQDLLAHLS